MIALTVIVCGCLLLAGLVVVLLAAIRAPQGYENEQGFFEGLEPQLKKILPAGETRLACGATGAPRGYADARGAYAGVELLPQEGPGAVEPVLSTYRASPHGHGAQ